MNMGLQVVLWGCTQKCDWCRYVNTTMCEMWCVCVSMSHVTVKLTCVVMSHDVVMLMYLCVAVELDNESLKCVVLCVCFQADDGMLMKH